MTHYLAVALGGALGSMGRYWVSLALNKYTQWLPLGTLVVNVLGALAIGFVWAYLQQRTQSEMIRLSVSVGILGGFTTFSSFSLETMQLIASGSMAQALINIGLNIIICLFAVAAGLSFGRWLF